MNEDARAAKLWFANGPGDNFVLVVWSPKNAVVARVRQTSAGPVMLYETLDPAPSPEEQKRLRSALSDMDYPKNREFKLAAGNNQTRIVVLNETTVETFVAWCRKSERLVEFTRTELSAALASRSATVGSKFIQ